MPIKKRGRVSIQTAKGIVYIEPKLDKEMLRELAFPFEDSYAPAYSLLHATRQIFQGFTEKGGSVSLALLEHKTIIGYALLDYPDKTERWAHLNDNAIMELKAVEVLRDYRHHGIARQLLIDLFSEPLIEEKILYLTAYSWTWDLAYSGFTIQSYRKMLISLYTASGFIESQTNEPNICLKPENLFMVRIGRNVPLKVQDDFKLLRFGILL